MVASQYPTGLMRRWNMTDNNTYTRQRPDFVPMIYTHRNHLPDTQVIAFYSPVCRTASLFSTTGGFSA
jgi:hypothetical protein